MAVWHMSKTNDQLLIKLEKSESNLEELQKKYNQMEEEYKSQEQRYLDALHKTRDYQELSSTMQGEAGGQGSVGIEHCTSTVVNRIATNHWGTTIHDVISAPGQYNAYGVTYDEINPEVIAAVDKVLLYGSTNDAIYYMNPETSSKSSRSWMRTKPFILKYKDHEFYGQ